MGTFKFQSLTGAVEFGEVWSPGPLEQTLWVLRDSDHAPVVVSVYRGADRQVEYTPPAVPGPTVPKSAVAAAYDVIHREYVTKTILGRDWYGRQYIAKERDYSVEAPTEAEVVAAHAILDMDSRNRKAHWTFTEAHTAPVPLATARFVAWAKVDAIVE